MRVLMPVFVLETKTFWISGYSDVFSLRDSYAKPLFLRRLSLLKLAWVATLIFYRSVWWFLSFFQSSCCGSVLCWFLRLWPGRTAMDQPQQRHERPGPSCQDVARCCGIWRLLLPARRLFGWDSPRWFFFFKAFQIMAELLPLSCT